MLKGVDYTADGRLADNTGHTWQRVSDWVEPADADRYIADGMPFLIQECAVEDIYRGRPERYPRDIRRRMLTRDQARRYDTKMSVPTVMVGELWRSQKAGDLLFFIGQGPHPR